MVSVKLKTLPGSASGLYEDMASGASARPRVVFYGLGTIGRGALKLALETGAVTPVAGVDPRKDLLGKDLGELVDMKKLGIPIAATLAEAMDGREADAAIHTTESRVVLVSKQIRELVDEGLSVVTSCEEMIFPWHAAAKEADSLDKRAKERGVCVYGAGVNPGFVMDRLPVAALHATTRVSKVRVRRVVDSLSRRPQLRAKTGAGMSAEEFAKLVQAGRMGHVGLVESALFVARALEGLGHGGVEKVDGVTEPALAAADIAAPEGRIAKGRVAGVHQTCTVTLKDGCVVLLDLTIAAGAEAPGDAVQIDGDPPVRFEIQGGMAGDVATASSLLNGVSLALHRPPGIARE